MLVFREITVDDRAAIIAKVGNNPSGNCEMTFGVVGLWNIAGGAKVCVDGETMYFVFFEDGRAYFQYPIGGDEEAGLAKIDEFCANNGYRLTYRYLSESRVPPVMARYGVTPYADRDWADYVYRSADLKSLSGKRYHGQKNHVNRFAKDYPDHVFVPYTDKRRGDVDKFLARYYDEHGKEGELFDSEMQVIQLILDNFAACSQLSGLLYVENEIVAIAFGEIVGDMLYVHIEKALRSFAGSYSMINYLFANRYANDVTYINREEDIGDEGLRKAKLNLHPAFLVQKYIVDIDSERNKK